MKKLIFVLVVIIFAACSTEKLTMSEAKLCSDNFLNALKENNFEQALKYYSTDEYYSESTENRAGKMEELANSIGKVISYSIIDSVLVEDKEGVSSIVLTYKVENEKINSLQTFIIQKEGSDYKIVSQDVKAGE